MDSRPPVRLHPVYFADEPARAKPKRIVVILSFLVAVVWLAAMATLAAAIVAFFTGGFSAW